MLLATCSWRSDIDPRRCDSIATAFAQVKASPEIQPSLQGRRRRTNIGEHSTGFPSAAGAGGGSGAQEVSSASSGSAPNQAPSHRPAERLAGVMRRVLERAMQAFADPALRDPQGTGAPAILHPTFPERTHVSGVVARRRLEAASLVEHQPGELDGGVVIELGARHLDADRQAVRGQPGREDSGKLLRPPWWRG